MLLLGIPYHQLGLAILKSHSIINIRNLWDQLQEIGLEAVVSLGRLVPVDTCLLNASMQRGIPTCWDRSVLKGSRFVEHFEVATLWANKAYGRIHDHQKMGSQMVESLNLSAEKTFHDILWQKQTFAGLACLVMMAYSPAWSICQLKIHSSFYALPSLSFHRFNMI